MCTEGDALLQLESFVACITHDIKMANFTAELAPTWVTNEAKIENVHGAQVAFNTSGSCVYHPDILLRKKKLTGGWKILEKECPRCKIEWEDRRRAALNKRSTSSSYLNPGQPTHQFSLPQRPTSQQHLHSPPQTNPSPPFHAPQIPAPLSHHPHTQSPFFQAPVPFHQPNSGHTFSQLQPIMYPSGRVPQISVPSEPPRPYAPVPAAEPPPQPSLEIQLPGGFHHTHAALSHNPDSSPWVSEPHMQPTLSDDSHLFEIEVDEADEPDEETDPESDIIVAFNGDDVETILAIMREYQGSPTVQGTGCNALLKLCNRCDENARTVLYCGAEPTIQAAYNFFKDSDAHVAGDGFVLLELFKRLQAPSELSDAIPEEPTPEQIRRREKSSLASLLPIDPHDEDKAKPDLNLAYKRDDIDSILKIMRKLVGSSVIQGIGCKALWRLGHRYGKLEMIINCGGVQVIDDAVFFFGEGNDDVAGYGQMLLDLADRQTNAGDTALDVESARQTPFTSLAKVDPRIEKIACDDVKFFGSTHAIVNVCAIMQWYPGSCSVQADGCQELCNVMHHSSSWDELTEHRAIQTIMVALYYYMTSNSIVNEYGFKLLDVIAPHQIASEAMTATEVEASVDNNELAPTSYRVAEPSGTAATQTLLPETSGISSEVYHQPALGDPTHASDVPIQDFLSTDGSPPSSGMHQEVALDDLSPESVNETTPPAASPEQLQTKSPPMHGVPAERIEPPKNPQQASSADCLFPEVSLGAIRSESSSERADFIVTNRLKQEPSATRESSEAQHSACELLISDNGINMVSRSEIVAPDLVGQGLADVLPSGGNTSQLDFLSQERVTVDQASDVDEAELTSTATYTNSIIPTVLHKSISVPPALRALVRNTKNFATDVTLSLAHGERPSLRPLMHGLKNRTSQKEDHLPDMSLQKRHPMSSSFTRAELSGAYSRTLTSRNVAALPRLDPDLEKIAMDEVHSMFTHDDANGLLAVMRLYPGSAVVQGHGCMRLWEICNRPNKTAVALNGGGIDVVEDALFYFGNSTDDDDNLFGYGTALLDLFRWTTEGADPDTQRLLSRAPHGDASFSPVDPRVEQVLADTLVRLGSSRDVDRVLSFMRRYPGSPNTQGHGCKALWDICQDIDGLTSVANCDAEKVVEASVRIHGHVDSNLADFGSSLLNLLQNPANEDACDHNLPKSVNAEALEQRWSSRTQTELAVAAVSRPEGSPVMAERIMPPLSSFGSTDPLIERIATNSLKSFNRDNDVEGVLTLMRRHRGSGMIQGQGVKKLWEFCFLYDKVESVLNSNAKEIVEDAVYYFGKTDSNVEEFAPLISELFG
jgi:hypothetical protein